MPHSRPGHTPCSWQYGAGRPWQCVPQGMGVTGRSHQSTVSWSWSSGCAGSAWLVFSDRNFSAAFTCSPSYQLTTEAGLNKKRSVIRKGETGLLDRGLHSGLKHRTGECIYGAVGAKIVNISH